MLVVLFIRLILVLSTAYVTFFTLWRTFEREHLDDIPKAIDRLIIASLISIYLARLPDAVDLLLRHAISPLAVLNPLVGTSSWQVAIVLFCISLYVLCKENWRDTYALLDFSVVAVAMFLAGALLWQLVTSLVSVLLTKGTFNPALLIVFVLGAIFFFILSRLLAYFERQYRAYFWYRYRRSSAQTGFVTCVFLIASGIFGIIFNLPQLPFAVLSLPMFLTIWSLFTMVGGFVFLYIRSGRLKKR